MNKLEAAWALLSEFNGFLPQICSTPTAAFYAAYHEHLGRIEALARLIPEHRRDLIAYFQELTREHLEVGLLHPRARMKPLGYAGDYLLLDWIHTSALAAVPLNARLWDEFFHLQDAPKAVRGRKTFFVDLVGEIVAERNSPISVLDLACGSSRDVAEAIANAGESLAQSRFVCVDQEQDAIAYSRRLVSPQADRHGVDVEFIRRSVLRVNVPCEFDLVWAAGLFDYLSDDVAVALLKRMWRWTKVRGRVVVGNFHPRNRTRSAQEWCLDWQLIHRTEDELRSLLVAAGIATDTISVTAERTGTIIFGSATKR